MGRADAGSAQTKIEAACGCASAAYQLAIRYSLCVSFARVVMRHQLQR